MDRHFALEMNYLVNCAGPAMENLVHNLVLSALPSHDNHEGFSIEQSMVAVDKLQAHAAVVALGSGMAKELTTIHQLLTSLSEARAPSEAIVQGMSSWFKTVVGRCEHFLTHQ